MYVTGAQAENGVRGGQDPLKTFIQALKRFGRIIFAISSSRFPKCYLSAHLDSRSSIWVRRSRFLQCLSRFLKSSSGAGHLLPIRCRSCSGAARAHATAATSPAGRRFGRRLPRPLPSCSGPRFGRGCRSCSSRAAVFLRADPRGPCASSRHTEGAPAPSPQTQHR